MTEPARQRGPATVPSRIQHLPVDERGYPVPWFVAWIDGKPDFRVADSAKLQKAVSHHRCWVCGEPLGRYKAFVIGPMCTVNRISAEPPLHRKCATYSVRVCPFLTLPRARRRQANLPENHETPAGHMIERNPGVCVVWITTTYQVRSMPNGVLFEIGDPAAVHWCTEGRLATREEAETAFTEGLPTLQELADQQGWQAQAELDRLVEAAKRHFPEPA